MWSRRLALIADDDQDEFKAEEMQRNHMQPVPSPGLVKRRHIASRHPEVVGSRGMGCLDLEPARTFRKIPHAHKNKIGTSTPPSKKPRTPPLKGGILWAWGFSPAERTQKCQAPIKLAQPFPAQNCGQKFYGHHAFSEPLPPPPDNPYPRD